MRWGAVLLLLLPAAAWAQQVSDPMPIGGGSYVTPRFGYLHIERPARTATDGTDMYVYRDANYVGGTPGSINTLAGFNTTVRAGALPHEWNLYAGIDNYTTFANNSENVGLYVQSKKRSTGATWGAVNQVLDYSTGVASRGAIALELNVSATGADTGNNRIGLEMYHNAIPGGTEPVMMRADISLDGVFASRTYGIELNGTGANYWTNIVGLSGSAHYGTGINLIGGTCDVAAFVSPNFEVGCTGGTSIGGATNHGTGTLSVLGLYYAGDTPGVTCPAGVNPTTMRVKNGIVTAC